MGIAKEFEKKYPNGVPFVHKRIEPRLLYKTNTRPTWIEAYLSSYQNAEGSIVPSILIRGYGKGQGNVYEVYVRMNTELTALFDIADAIENGDLFEAFYRQEQRRLQVELVGQKIVGENFSMNEAEFREIAYAIYKKVMANPITENNKTYGDFLVVNREYFQPVIQKNMWKIQKLMVDYHLIRNIGGKYKPSQKPWKITIYNRTVNTAYQIRKGTIEEIRAAAGKGRWFEIYLTSEDMVRLGHKVFEEVMGL